jgi:hypothetical protein
MPRHVSFLGIGQAFAERLDQERQVILDGIPDDGRALVPTSMDREVAQIDHRLHRRCLDRFIRKFRLKTGCKGGSVAGALRFP